MNFDFSEDLNQVRAEARAFLTEHAAGSARRALEAGSGFDRDLWQQIGKLGWIGAAIPEEFGGSGLGDEGLCVLAEEIGHSLAATPFASTAYLASQAVLRFGSAAQKTRWLPGLANGSVIGCFALAEGPGAPRAASVHATIKDGKLDGTKQPVVDGGIAHLAVVAARDGADIVLALVDLSQPNVTRERLESLDPSRDTAKLTFANAAADALPGARSFGAIETLLDRAAILFAFEQLGGAQAASRWRANTRCSAKPSAAKSDPSKPSSTNSRTSISPTNWPAATPITAPGRSAPMRPTSPRRRRRPRRRHPGLRIRQRTKTSRPMAAWASPGNMTAISTSARAKHWRWPSVAAPYWKDRLVGFIERQNAA